MSTLSQYIGDTDIIARFRVRQLRVAVRVFLVIEGQHRKLEPPSCRLRVKLVVSWLMKSVGCWRCCASCWRGSV